MVTETIQAPHPLRSGPVLRRRNGKPILIQNVRLGDRIDLATGECHLARVIDGVRCDTERADLVLWHATSDYGYYRMQQVFRGHDGQWFLVTLTYNTEWDQCEGGAIRRLTNEMVPPKLREILGNTDGWPLLCDWYLDGWLPRDDAFVQAWAEATLSADECEFLLNGLAAIPDNPSA